MFKIAVDPKKCNGCGDCADVCLFQVIEMENGKAIPMNDSCEGCQKYDCEEVCENNAIAIIDKMTEKKSSQMSNAADDIVAKKEAEILIAKLNSGQISSRELLDNILPGALDIDSSSISRYYFSDGDEVVGKTDAAKILLKCLRCENIFKLPSCSNCGHSYYYTGNGMRFRALKCDKCYKILEFWKCSCGCDNPLVETTYQRKPEKKSGCFIATACYDSYDSPELHILRNYRDEILANSTLGRIFIDLYYKISPPIAEVIKGRKCLKQFLKKYILNILVGYCCKKLDKIS